MPIDIETFSNARGGNAAYKALSHPLAAARARALLDRLAGAGPVALYDPHGLARGFAALYDLSRLRVAGVFGQRTDQLGQQLLGHAVRPVTELPRAEAASVLVAAFDAARPIDQVRHLMPPGARMESLDALRLPEEDVGNPRNYLDPTNFATNFAFFREGDGLHTRITTANYWAGYGPGAVVLRCRLFDGAGGTIAAWSEAVPDGPGGIVIDSRAVRARFGLSAFTGQLFLHAVGARGHDVVKYALDTYGDDPAVLSCTHDANAWPSDLFAGLPAPERDETVLLWIQNSHPEPVRPGEIGLALMGEDEVRRVAAAIPGYGTLCIDTRTLFPEAAWPAQFEVHTGKHCVRPRYEVVGRRRRIAHVNVERTDLAPDPALPRLGNLLGKGFILPAPILPPARWRTEVLPTPMSTCQAELPVRALFYDREGREVGRHAFGSLARRDSVALAADDALDDALARLDGGYGHMELVYDFDAGELADGWLHAIFRYRDRESGHAAETSFGAHVFNTAMVHRGEPQSYSGPPPGLSTRLFLRLGAGIGEEVDTLCHLIYPASMPWHPRSATTLELRDRDGRTIAEERLAIACGGSHLFTVRETFGDGRVARAGEGGYVLVRDTTCRLFGYHGLLGGAGAFSLDHMFGF